MATFSRYPNTPWQTVSSSLWLVNSATQSYEFLENKVVTDLLDNTDKLIMPISVRNAVRSLYDAIVFRENEVGGKKFIGIDTDSEWSLYNRFVPIVGRRRMPIYLGKRLYLGKEVVNTSILNAHDITIYNTKPDNSGSQTKTSMVFLTGTFSNSPTNSPKIDANVVSTNTGVQRIDISLINGVGDVSVLSKQANVNDPGGTMSVNGISYPTWQDSLANAGEEKTLVYSNNSVYWSGLTPSDPGFYGATGTNVPMFGKDTLVNGAPLYLTDMRYCPIEIGDITLGDTFEDAALSFVLERIIYDYLPPTCSLRLSDPSMEFPEIGSMPTISLRYDVTKKTKNTYPTALTNMKPSQIPQIVGPSRTISGTATGVVVLPVEATTTVFKITASDGTSFNSASASVTGVYPFFYGFTSSTEINNGLLRSLTKIVDNRSEQKIDIMGQKVNPGDIFYFIYDYDYGPLGQIRDPGNSDIKSGRFVETDRYLSSPSGYWAQKRMRVYVSTILGTLYTNNAVSAFFRFIF